MLKKGEKDLKLGVLKRLDGLKFNLRLDNFFV